MAKMTAKRAAAVFLQMAVEDAWYQLERFGESGSWDDPADEKAINDEINKIAQPFLQRLERIRAGLWHGDVEQRYHARFYRRRH